MELSFGEVIEGWIVGGKFLCVANGAKLFCVVIVGSRRLFCSKSLLSHKMACAMA
jgi:hypothetical protein